MWFNTASYVQHHPTKDDNNNNYLHPTKAWPQLRPRPPMDCRVQTHDSVTDPRKGGTSRRWLKHCKPWPGRHLTRMAKPGLADVWYYEL